MLFHPQGSALTRYAAGSAAEPLRRRLADHLADCTRCRSVVQSTRQLRTELAQSAPIAPPSALFTRIVESRAAGVRMLLPMEAPGTRTPAIPPRRFGNGGLPAARPIFWAALAGAAAVALVQLGTTRLDGYLAKTVGGERPRPIFPALLVVDPAAPAAGPFQVTRLRPMTLRYGSVSYERAGGRGLASNRITTIRLVRSGAAGSEWIAISEDNLRDRGPDSVWINAESLEPVQWRRNNISLGVSSQSTFRMQDDRIRAVRIDQPSRGAELPPLSAAKVVKLLGPTDTVYSLPPNHAPITMNRAHLIAAMLTLPLTQGWQGAFATVWVASGRTTISKSTIKIVGSRQLITPAGIFDCWEAVRRSDGWEQFQWYRKSDGLFIGEAARISTASQFLYRTLLLSEE